jgi:hypothetical protein
MMSGWAEAPGCDSAPWCAPVVAALAGCCRVLYPRAAALRLIAIAAPRLNVFIALRLIRREMHMRYAFPAVCFQRVFGRPLVLHRKCNRWNSLCRLLRNGIKAAKGLDGV